MALSTFVKSGRILGRNKKISGRSLGLSTLRRHNHRRRILQSNESENIWMRSVDVLRGHTYNYENFFQACGDSYQTKMSVSLITFPLMASSLMLAFLYKEKYMDEITPPLFESWCQEYGKVYSSEKEKDYRFKVFKSNYAKIIRSNRMNTPFDPEIGLNQNVDLTKEEFYAIYRHKGFYVDEEVYRLF